MFANDGGLFAESSPGPTQLSSGEPHAGPASLPMGIDVLNSRMRCLYLSYPLQQIVSNAESEHHKEWQGLNFTYLTLTLIDCIVAKMAPGSARGATRADVVQELAGAILAFRPDADDQMIGKIVDFIIEGVIGKDEFHEYQTVAHRDGRLVAEPFRVRLIRRTWSEELNLPVYTAEPQAVQLVLSMLDTPTMDAQKANMVIMQEHVKRGRLDAALESAQRDALLTQQFETEITGIIRAVQRDISLIDYNAHVKPKLDEAHEHAQRVGTERERIIRDLADQQQQYLEREESIPHAVTHLKQTLEQLQKHHTHLTTMILATGDTFLVEQNLQRFRVLAGVAVVNLAEKGLYPALAMPFDILDAHWAELADPCLGPNISRLADHGLIIDKLLVDRIFDGTPEDEETALAEIEVVPRELNRELENRFRRLLLDFVDGSEGTRLSVVLQVGREHQLTRKQLYLLALTVLRGLDQVGGPDYIVRNDGTPLNDPDLTGDDLILYPRPAGGHGQVTVPNPRHQQEEVPDGRAR